MQYTPTAPGATGAQGSRDVFQQQNEESCLDCSEMIHFSLAIQLFGIFLFTITHNDGNFFPGLC